MFPTPHRFEVGGHMLYTWCALDTLMYPVILKLPARVASPCPVTGEPILLSVTPEGIGQLSPPGAVASLVIPQQAEACRDVRGAFCNQVHFFSSREMASTWLEQRPTALLLSTDEAFHLGQMVVRYRYQELLGA
jgi:alkylmercury lyase